MVAFPQLQQQRQRRHKPCSETIKIGDNEFIPWNLEEISLAESLRQQGKTYVQIKLELDKFCKANNRPLRSPDAIRRKIGTEHKSNYYWTEREESFLKALWDGNNAKELAERLNRSTRTVEKKLRKLGLIQTRESRPWHEEEIRILSEVIQETGSICKAQKALDKWANKHSKSERVLQGIYNKAVKLGFNLREIREDLELMTPSEIARILGCTHHIVMRWARDPEMKRILKPKTEGEITYISRTNFKKFVFAFRGEFGKLSNVDSVGLINLLDN